MTECPECYSNKKRATPLQNPRDCLENHLQYICGTCGRCICINKAGKKRLAKMEFPLSISGNSKALPADSRCHRKNKLRHIRNHSFQWKEIL